MKYKKRKPLSDMRKNKLEIQGIAEIAIRNLNRYCGMDTEVGQLGNPVVDSCEPIKDTTGHIVGMKITMVGGVLLFKQIELGEE